MYFKKFLNESINFNSREVIVPKGEILYHGTIESFDIRKTRPGGYDEVFWTTTDVLVARSYIPSRGSYLNTSINSILRDKDLENMRKSLGLTKKIQEYAWKKHEEGYQKFAYWHKKYEEFSNKFREHEKARTYDELDDSFFQQWIEAENNYKKYQQEWKTYDYYLKLFVIRKMKLFGYEPYHNDYFTKIVMDKDGYLLPGNTKSIGRMLKVICDRDFKIYNYAYGKEGDLTDVDYHKISLFRQVEDKGYDGIIINDFAQTDYYGNYGHISVGFFKEAMKDLTIKPIRNQTHPSDEEWQRR